MKNKHLKIRRNFLRLIVLLVLGFFFVPKISNSQSINYRAQSLFIYKFTKHIYWPQANQSGDFVIGVYGNSPIFNELMTMATIKKAGKGQKIVIKKIRTIDQIKDMHLVYMTSSKSREVREIAEKLKGTPTLLVAERGGLAKKGASINFMVMENGDLRFEINLGELKTHKLTITDELKNLGFVVD